MSAHGDNNKVAMRRQLRVTFTFDVDVPDDRMLVDKVEKAALEMVRRGHDNTDGVTKLDIEGTQVVVHQHFVNRYFLDGKRLKDTDGGLLAPALVS